MFSRMRPMLSRLLTDLPLALPSSCALCGTEHRTALCDGCRAQFFSVSKVRCTCCGIPMPGEEGAVRCGECLKQPPAFDATVVATDYLPPVDRLVLALKFGKRLEVAPMFAQMLLPATKGIVLPHLLTAVPLGQQRLVQR